MKTVTLMQRPLLGGHITQHSKTEMFSATDLVKLGNSWRAVNSMPLFVMKAWLQNKGTKEFVSELQIKFGKDKVKKSARGRGAHTWLHPLLFIDMALAISPKLKIETYEWIFDSLIKHRNESGDSYKKMCGALFVRETRKTDFPKTITSVASKIKLACGVTCWEEATVMQLKLRSKLHNDIALLADVLNNNDEAVRLAILKSTGYEEGNANVS
ncbi:MAG: hypothetical protein ACJAYB_000084 [Psychromonas sp.]|jgi:hypothetical protein